MATSKIVILKYDVKVIITNPLTASEKVFIHNSTGTISFKVDEIKYIKKALTLIKKKRKISNVEKRCSLKEVSWVSFRKEKLYGQEDSVYRLYNSPDGYLLMDRFGRCLPGRYFDSDVVPVP